MQPLWSPTAQRVASTRIDEFRRSVAADRPDVVDSVALHGWSVQDPQEFWQRMWSYGQVIGDPGPVVFDSGDGSVRQGRFFPQSSLSYAENALAHRDGAGDEALVAITEHGDRRAYTWQQLREQVAALAAALTADGVQPGDRVAAYMPHVAETIITFLAANAIGATFTSTSSDFGIDGVVDRFGQTQPTVLVAADGYRYGGKEFSCLDRIAAITAQLPSLQRTVVVSVLADGADGPAAPDVAVAPALDAIAGGVHWADYLAPHLGASLHFQRLPGDHPVYILYSSGTTGKPKCITHRALGVLLMHLKEHQLHCDIRAGDRVLYFTTCGWMMWNWLVSVLASGATAVLFDGSPAHPSPAVLFDIAERERLTLLGVSAKYIDSVHKAGVRPIDSHDLSALRTVCSTGSPLSEESFRWVYEAMKPDVHLASISGGTDLCGCFVGGDPTRPVYAGEIQGPALGMAVEVYSVDGAAVVEPGVKGELVCTRPFPVMPVGFCVGARRLRLVDAARRHDHPRPQRRHPQRRWRAHRHRRDLRPGRAHPRGGGGSRGRPGVGRRHAHRALRSPRRGCAPHRRVAGPDPQPVARARLTASCARPHRAGHRRAAHAQQQDQRARRRRCGQRP